MIDPWYGPHDEDVAWVGKAAVLVATTSVLFGAGCVALAITLVDKLVRRR